MDENTNQPSTTPLGNERSQTPGQDNIITDMPSKAPSWDENTPLSDITKQYTDIGTAFTQIAENAADNVGDRQVQLVGNDFGATNPYMFNTYYEPSATAFASEMRQQGTQKALEEGLDRGEKEAQKRLSAAQSRYSNALAAAKQREEQQKNAKVHVSETDTSKMPEGVTEKEWSKFVEATEGMTDEQRRAKWTEQQTAKLQQNSQKMKPEDWNDKSTRAAVRKQLFAEEGITEEEFKKKSKADKDKFWADTRIGNRWTELYMTKYFYNTYGKTAGKAMETSFNGIRKTADKVVSAIKAKDLSGLTNEDVAVQGVKITSKAAVKDVDIDTIKSAVMNNEKLSKEKKEEYSKYLDDVEAKKYITGIANGDYQKSDKNFTQGEWYYKTDYSKLTGAYTDKSVTAVPKKNAMDKYEEIINAFGGTDSFGNTLLEEYKKGGDDNITVSSDYGGISGRLVDKADKKSFSASLQSAFGLDLDSWNKLNKMQKDNPADYAYLRDHAAFVNAGGAGAFEQVTDPNKKYYLNGKYWSANDKDSPISVGDLVFHTVEGTYNEDGEYDDNDLKNFLNLYKDIYTGKKEASDKNIAALKKYYNEYNSNLMMSYFLGDQNGTSVNENIYHMVLALRGKGDTSKMTVVNPENPDTKISVDALKSWFESMDDDAKYNVYTELSKKAREARGVLRIVGDGGQIYDAGLKGENDIDTVGKYGKNENDANMQSANKIKNLSSTDALAIVWYIDQQMKDEKISKGFLDNDEYMVTSNFFNSAQTALKGMAQFWSGLVIGGLGSLGPKDADGSNSWIRAAGDLWGDMSTLDESDDMFHGSGQTWANPYTGQVRDKQRSNLNHMIDTTFNLKYFDPDNKIEADGTVKDKDGNVIGLDAEHHNEIDSGFLGKGMWMWASGIAGNIAEFALETFVTAGASKLVQGSFKVGTRLLGKGLSKAASKSPTIAKGVVALQKAATATAKALTTPVTVTAVKSALMASKAAGTLDNIASTFGDDIVRGISEGTIKNSDDFIAATAKNAAKNNADNVAGAAAKGSAEQAAKEGASKTAGKIATENADNIIADNADNIVADNADNITEKFSEKGGTAAADLSKEADTVIVNTADGGQVQMFRENIDDIIKNVQEGSKTLQRDYAIRYGIDAVADNIDDSARAFSNRFLTKIEKFIEQKHVFRGMNESMRSLMKDSIADAVSRASVNGRLAAATGLATSRIASLSDETAAVLYGVLRASERGADDIASIAVEKVAGRVKATATDVALNKIDFKKAATKIVEMSESAANSGFRLSLDDVFRTIAIQGSIEPGQLLASLKRSKFVNDRIKDWSRDIVQNYTSPELDSNFESHYIDFETYISSPEQWLQSILFDVGNTALGSLKTRAKLHFTDAKIDKLMGGIDYTSANKADRAKMRKDLIKLDNLRTKSMQLNNDILDGKISFKRVSEVANKAENAIHDHIASLTGDLDMVKSAELVTSQSAQAMEEAQTALAKGTRKGRREYKKILADADQINRIIIRGNDKLMAFQEVNASLQQVSITRYLDIDAHSKTIRKMTGKQWGAAVSDAFDELKDVDFAKVYGEADAKSFTGYTINVKDKEKAKAAYRVGQDLVYNTIYNKITAIMGGSLTVSEKRELKAELNMLKERMIASGESIIDDGGKVRWNYFPTQALTWEAEPGSSSAVRALWGWDYKGGMHTGIAGEIANPELARDQWDIFKINQDYRNGQETFKRRRGDADKAREEGRTGKANVEQFRDVQYNWEGYNPAYAVNAYLNSLDSAKYVSPLLDPINGIVVKNPEAALAVSKMSIRQMRAQESAINTKYDTMIAKKLEQKKTAKANRTSKKSLERRAKLVEDFSGSTKKVLSSDAQAKVSSIEANEVKVRRDTQKKIHDSPLVSTLADLYVRRGDVTGVEANRFAVNKLNDSFNQLGNDIKAVRDMYRKDGKLKKKYLGKDGNVLPKYLDVEGNIVPENMTGTFAMDSATQYRRFVNQLANNKSLNTDIFDPDNHRIIKFDDGSQINAMAFQKELYDVLCTKQILDLGYSESEGRKSLALRKSMSGDSNFDPELVISKRLQPVEVDDVEARRTLTKGATGMLEQIYGTKNKFTGSYDLDPQMDTLLQDAVAKAWDDVEAHGGEINIYDFTREVDKHLPDFVKVGNKASTKELNDVMRLLRRYESAGGTNAELLADLRNAIDIETDPAKKATLTTAYNTVKQLDDYNNRTTNRAGLDNSLDETLDGGDDASSDEVLTRGDITADENLSGQQEGLANTYVPKGVDENLIGSAEGETRANIEKRIAEIEDLEHAAATSSEPDTKQQLKALGKEKAELQKRLESAGGDSVAEQPDVPQVDLEAYPNMKNAPGQSSQAGASVETFKGNWTPIDVASSKDKVFLFGDNIEDAKTGYRPTSTQAVIRGEENAIGIPTKKNRGTSAASYFTDADFDEFKTGVDDAIAKAKASGKTIVLPENGIGTGAAQLEKRAPKCFEYLQSQLDALSSTSQSTQSDVSLSDWMDAELNRHSSKRRYDSKTIASIAEKYQDRVIKAQTKEEIAKVSEDIAADLIPLDPSVKNSATEIRQAASDIQNAIFWSKQTAPTAAPQKIKVISGGQTGVDTIGLEVGKELGLETGGTAAPGFYRFSGEDQYTAKDMAAFGLKEIDPKLQAEMAKTRKQFYLPRTRQNVINSDGTVYFSSNTNSTGYAATKRFADASGKPFILNPTASQLREWMSANNVKTLNIAGSRGGHIDDNFSKHVKDVLNTALKDPVEYKPIAAVSKPVTPAGQVSALAESLDIINANKDSNWAQRREYRNNRRQKFDALENQFNVISDILESKIVGKNIRTAYDILPTNQVLTPETISKKFSDGNVTISNTSAKKLDNYQKAYENAAKKKTDAAKKKLIDSYKTLAESVNTDQAKAAQKARVEGGTGIYRGTHLLEGAKDRQVLALASGQHEVRWDPDYGQSVTYKSDGTVKSTYDKSVSHADVRNMLTAGTDGFGNIVFMDPKNIDEFIKKNNLKISDDLKKRIDAYKAAYAADSDYITAADHRYRVADSTVSMNDSFPEYLSSMNEVDANGNPLLHSLPEGGTSTIDYRSEGTRYKTANTTVEDAKKVYDKAKRDFESADPNDPDFIEKMDAMIAARLEYETADKRVQKEIDQAEIATTGKVDENGNIKTTNTLPNNYRNQILSGDVEGLYDYPDDNRGGRTNIDDYADDREQLYTPTYATPYADYLNATDHVNVSEESNKLNTLFYGNGDNTGFFDSMDKLAGEKNEAMGGIAIDFDESISDKLTELKKLDGAKDGEVITILEAAKQQADGIENKTVRDYINKRLDEEIDFAKKNLELKPGTSAKVRADFLNHDPEYKALKTRQKGMLAERGSKNAMYTPSGSHPVFIDGNVTPDGHYTLQQLLDARREVDLSRKKNGKNGFKSSKETRDILNSMRKDFNDGYDGSSLISSGAARQNDAWMLNLYARVHESAGLEKLPKTPSFAEIEAGKMTATVDGKEVEIALPLKMSDIYIDPQVAALGAHYWGEGKSTKVEMVYKAATALSNFSKAIQDIQLAGGVGQFNALTLRNAITMMWQDPIGGTRALFSNFHNARNNDSVVKFYLDNHEKLLKMAIDSGDFSTINGFVNVVNMRDEIGGRGMIQEFSKQVGEIPNVFKDKGLHHGFWGNASNLYEAIFQNPTFVRWMAVAKADMQIRNYDKATRFVNRIQAKYNLTDDDFRYVEGGMGSKDKYIATLAKLRTDRYWTPSEFAMSKGRAQTYLQRQSQDIMKRTSESLRGMPQKKTIRQCLSDFFFAIGYKLQMNAHPVSGIATIFTALPNSIRAGNQVANRRSFNLMSSRFSGRGNRNQALVMIGIAALAHIYNTYNGFPSAWEELWSDHGDPNNGTAGLPQTLMNFQDLGKFHIRKGDNPNDYYTADPFFSVFTLQNSAMRATNKAIFPNQIPYNTQRTFAQEDNQNLISRIQGVSDELIGANLLSGYKAIYEVLNNNTYFGNNIWEQPKLPNGENNPNYNPLRNMIASVAHILNTEEWWFGTESNRWVKGLDIDAETWKDGKQVDPYTKGIFGKIGERGKYNGKTGTVAGSGIFQHEYVTALKHINDGEYFEALTESMELPFKSRNYEAKARTQLNTDVMMALRNARKEYDEKVKNASPDEKNQAYAAFAKKAVDIVHDWSAKNEYALGKNGELDATATKMLVSFMADEYDDVTNRIMNRYDKLRQDLKMADGDEFLFSTDAMNAAIADGMDDDVAAEKHNAHLKALQEAYIKEYDARQALIKAGIDPDQFDTPDYIHDDLSAIDATFDKKTFKELTAAFNKPIGEFSNYEEMKNYYEELIANASTTKQKAKLANQYNKYVTDVIAPYVGKGFAAQAFNDIYWDSKNLSNELGKYVIIPADKYYTGKSPRASYLKDLLGIGYRNNENLPSDKDIVENIAKVNQALAKGQTSSAASLVDNALLQLRKGTLHASPEDRQKLIRMRALLSSRRK